MIYSKITGTGSYLPEQILTNADLEEMVDTSDDWIRSRTGIEKRHVARNDETTCDLAEKASRTAMEAAKKNKDDIDLIIVATTTPDLIFPSTACLLQQRLGIRGCPAFDIQAVCTGFVYALHVADLFIKTGNSKCALIVGSETMTRIVDWKDRNTCVLFGDGAGAVILEESKRPGILSTHIHADGAYQELLSVPAGISSDYNLVKSDKAFIKMQGNEVFKVAVNTLGSIVDETLRSNSMSSNEIDWLVPHQANTRIISAMAKKLDMPMDRVVVTVDKHGISAAASMPLAL